MTLKAKDHVCPKCGIPTHSFKDYIIRKLKHKVLINFDSIIFYNQRRYLCKNCDAIFIEDDCQMVQLNEKNYSKKDHQ